MDPNSEGGGGRGFGLVLGGGGVDMYGFTEVGKEKHVQPMITES